MKSFILSFLLIYSLSIQCNPLLRQLLIVKEEGVEDALNSKNKEFLARTFLDQEITEEMLQELREETLFCLHAQGDFASTLVFPEQDIASGRVTLNVVPMYVRNVKIEGNRWNSEAFYRKQISLAENSKLDTNQVLNQVAWVNRNPFNYTEVILTPSIATKYMDVDLLVKDRFFLRPFTGSDNTGTNLTNTARIYGGMTWGKAFGRSDLFTYQYTTAPNPHEFYAHSGSYLLFLPWEHELLFFGGFSVAHPDLGASFSHEGISVQASLRYNIPIKPLYTAFKHTVSWGIDYKNFNSNVFFIDANPAIPIVAQQANISQFYLGYTVQDRYFIRAEILFSPIRLLPHQSDARYGQLRPHATVHYMYGKASLTDTYNMGNRFSFTWALRAQGAMGPLLPSEQFALGGYDTVRGYQERDFLADNALCLNAEIRAHKLSFFKKDELIFLFFSDFGYGANFDSELSSQTSQSLWSTGFGARYQIAPYVSLRVDYGIQLNHIFGQDTFGRCHLGGSISY